MKQVTLLILLLPFFGAAQSQFELAFTIAEKDFIPEGIAFNPLDQSFYVGSIHKNKIVKISKGIVIDFVSSHQDNIGQVVGLRIDPTKQELWACSNEGEGIIGGKSFVHQYSLKTGKLIRQFVHQEEGETHFFNDAVLVNGTLYVTDSEFRAIYKIDPSKDQHELFLKTDRLSYANGITTLPNSNKLVISTGSGLTVVDTDTKEISALPFSDYYIVGIDGLYTYENSLIAIQNVTFPVSINRYFLNPSQNEVTNAELILTNHPSFDVPTTGAIAGDWFYFIANSQLSNYSKGKIENADKLKEVAIMKIKLK